MEFKSMNCPQCGNGLAAMSEDDGAAYWCTSRLKNGEKCHYSTYVEYEKEERSIAPTRYEYMKYHMGY